VDRIGRKHRAGPEEAGDEWIGPEPDDPEFWRTETEYEPAPGNAEQQVEDFFNSGVRYVESHLVLLPDNVAKHEYLIRMLKYVRDRAREFDAAAAGGTR